MVQSFSYQKFNVIKNLLKSAKVGAMVRDELGGDFVPNLGCEHGQMVVLDSVGCKFYIDLVSNNLVLTKYLDENMMEVITIGTEGSFRLVCRDVIELRDYGMVVTKLWKVYRDLCQKGMELLLLEERQFAYKKDTISKVFPSVDFNLDDVWKVYSKIRDYNFRNTEGEDYRNVFQVSLKIEGFLQGDHSSASDYLTDFYVGLNGEDISSFYQGFDGDYQVTRIYDLYCGVINNYTSRDIYLIHLNRLNSDIFALKELRGIERKIEAIVGVSKVHKSQEYCQYVDSFLRENFGQDCCGSYERDHLLDCIIDAGETVYLDHDKEFTKKKRFDRRKFPFYQKKNLNSEKRN